MDLSQICEVLAATQQSDEALRKAGEQKLDEAKQNSPDMLVQALLSVLAAGENVVKELRQQAAVILRQRAIDFDELQEATRKAVKAQALLSVQNDPEHIVQRNAGYLVPQIIEGCEDMAAIGVAWPELLPWLSEAAGDGNQNASSRAVALQVLKGIIPAHGTEMLTEHCDQFKALLSKALSNGKPEVRAAGAQIVLSFIEHSETELLVQLSEAMPAVTMVLQGLATGSTEKELEETLAAIQEAAEAEAEFFFEHNFETLWTTLMTIVNADKGTFANEEVQHSAMECIMNITKGNCNDDKFKATGALEKVVEVNFLWLLDVEEDVGIWTAEGKKDSEDDDCDDEKVRIGEESFDILGETYDEDDIMPIITKVCAAACANGEWRTMRASIMAKNQVLEHLEDDTQVDVCINEFVRMLDHPHPRVRYSAWGAIGQSAYDQSERFNDNYAADLMKAVIKGLKDDNFRVAQAVVEALGCFADDLDFEDLEEHLGELLTLLFKHIDTGVTHKFQELCIEAISNIADACEEDFAQYYGQVMPLIKQLTISATAPEQQLLRGKAFNCASVIGSHVGKDIFVKDACALMDVMLPLFQAGFAADSSLREQAHEASGNIIETIGKDFKPYVNALLPSIFKVLQQTPKEISELYDDPDLDDEIVLNDVGSVGLKVSVTDEMEEALTLLLTLAGKLEEEFSDFVADTVQTLLPMLDYPLPDDVREQLFKTWGRISKCARSGIQHQRLDPNVIRVLATEFLKKAVGYLSKIVAADVCEGNQTICANMRAFAVGASEVISNCGEGVLTNDVVTDVARVVGQLLATIVCSEDSPTSGGKKKKKKAAETMDDEDELGLLDDDDDDDEDFSPQAVRFALVQIMSSLLRTNTDVFVREVLPTMMNQLLPQKLLVESSSDADKSLAFYIANDVTDILGAKSVAYWGGYMNQALIAAADEKRPTVQRHAVTLIGTGSKNKECSVMALAACERVYAPLQKHGAKHKRRRVKPSENPAALAIDACVRTLGLICEHQEQTLGEHAPRAWSMWLASLPIKYDYDAAHEVHEQLLKLLAREHPALLTDVNLPLVLKILVDVYKTKFSTKQLDKDIAFAFEKIGPEKLEVLCSGFKEAQKKKTEQMLKSAKAAGGA